jgi:hypothetical protein
VSFHCFLQFVLLILGTLSLVVSCVFLSALSRHQAYCLTSNCITFFGYVLSLYLGCDISYPDRGFLFSSVHPSSYWNIMLKYTITTSLPILSGLPCIIVSYDAKLCLYLIRPCYVPYEPTGSTNITIQY